MDCKKIPQVLQKASHDSMKPVQHYFGPLEIRDLSLQVRSSCFPRCHISAFKNTWSHSHELQLGSFCFSSVDLLVLGFQSPFMLCRSQTTLSESTCQRATFHLPSSKSVLTTCSFQECHLELYLPAEGALNQACSNGYSYILTTYLLSLRVFTFCLVPRVYHFGSHWLSRVTGGNPQILQQIYGFQSEQKPQHC